MNNYNHSSSIRNCLSRRCNLHNENFISSETKSKQLAENNVEFDMYNNHNNINNNSDDDNIIHNINNNNLNNTFFFFYFF